ncbi:putative mitochondrial carrier [Escovopsis weberi]|uniref:Putative mitochondrial carrier n=1 Tax=Escovopsis weberi TaxID=150374 RepID=A0A0M8MYZ3_ESCWE|nr:putative mitochondrial carrier [Escovopsis weberi]
MKETYLASLPTAALTVDILVYPLDTLKTRYQSQDFVTKNALPPGQKTLALKGLYQGIGSVVLATLPAAGIFFSTYESAKVFLSPGAIPVPEPVTHSLASATAEMASCLVLAPAEVIKQNAQMVRGDAARASGSASASLLAFRRLTQTGTAGRLFSGYTALVARNLPFTALQFPIFEYTRARLWRARARRGKGEGGSDERTLPETGLVAGRLLEKARGGQRVAERR